MPNKPPRIPGSQVAPNQRPFVAGGVTATTHSMVPIAQATAGKTYRVRCKDWVNVWGEGLSWDDAVKLKERVVTTKQSKTARVQDEAEEAPPDWYLAQHGLAPPVVPAVPDYDDYVVAVPPPSLAVGSGDVPVPIHAAARSTQYSLDEGGVEVAVPAAGVVSSILAGHELVVNGTARPVPTQVAAGDLVVAVAVDPEIVAARALALAQARAAIPAARLKPQYRDKTVRPRVAPKGPPPKDKTAGSQVHVRLTAAPAPAMPEKKDLDLLPSPLKVATVQDGKPLPDWAIGEDDLSDLAVDVGGGPSDADIEHAGRQRDAESKAG